MLRTEIVEGQLRSEDHSVDPYNIEFYQAENVHHDATYAHALVQAMDEFGIDEFDVILHITRRAAEIMRGFGYDTDA